MEGFINNDAFLVGAAALDVNLRVHLPHTLGGCARFHLDLSDFPPGHIKSIFITEVNGDASSPAWTHRTNVFFRSMLRRQPFRANQLESVTSITLNHLWLDDWDPLVQLLKLHGASVDDLFLNQCFLTERGARTLGHYLYEFSNKYNPDFRSYMTQAERKDSLSGLSCLERVVLMNVEGSNSWMLGDEIFSQYQTWIGLSHCVPTLARQDPRIWNLTEIKRAEYLKFSGDSGGFQDITVDIRNPHRHGQYLALEQKAELQFHEKKDFPLNLCHAIGKLLCQATNLVELYVHLVADELPHDFLLGAINCTKLILDGTNYDPYTVACLVHGEGDGAGNLKNLKLENFDEYRVAKLLELVDLSLLDSLELAGDFRGKNISRVFDSFCRRFANDEGPKRLSINLQDDLNNFVPQLTPSLIGNHKIECLDILAISCESTNDGGLNQLFDAIGKMPNLQFWSLQWDNKEDLDKATIKRWNNWVLEVLHSNWNIHGLHVDAFDLEDNMCYVALENTRLKNWPPLLRQKEKFSSGIWSLALSRIQKDEVSLLFRVLKEVPGLFQQTAEPSQQSLHLPSFNVQHHPNCPGCRRQNRQCASRARRCTKRPKMN